MAESGTIPIAEPSTNIGPVAIKGVKKKDGKQSDAFSNMLTAAIDLPVSGKNNSSLPNVEADTVIPCNFSGIMPFAVISLAPGVEAGIGESDDKSFPINSADLSFPVINAFGKQETKNRNIVNWPTQAGSDQVPQKPLEHMDSQTSMAPVLTLPVVDSMVLMSNAIQLSSQARMSAGPQGFATTPQDLANAAIIRPVDFTNTTVAWGMPAMQNVQQKAVPASQVSKQTEFPFLNKTEEYMGLTPILSTVADVPIKETGFAVIQADTLPLAEKLATTLAELKDKPELPAEGQKSEFTAMIEKHQQAGLFENQAAIRHDDSGSIPADSKSSGPSDPYNIMKQIVDQARVVNRVHNSEMVVKLKPEHLGELTLKVTVENGSVSASFISNNQEVRTVIEVSLPQLKQELINQGLRVDSVGIYAGLNQFFANDQQRAAPQQLIKVRNRKTEEQFVELAEAIGAVTENGTDGVDYRI